MADPHAKTTLAALAAETWAALAAQEPMVALGAGMRVTRYPRGDLADAEAGAAAARERKARLDGLDLTGLDRTERMTAAYLRYVWEMEIEAPALWWISFGVAPYSGSSLGMVPALLFPPIDLTDEAEAQRYLTLAEGYAEAVVGLRERVLAQAGKGWRLPKPALANARVMIQGAATRAVASISVSEERPASDAVSAAAARIIEDQITPAFDRLLETLGQDYEAKAPSAVGLQHQPEGKDAYRRWIRFHLGYDLEPADLHATGLAEVERLAAEMERVRRECFGHDGDEASFHARLADDPRAKAASAEALESIYHGHLARMQPVFARIFRRAPQARPNVERLPTALEAGMTFGYYDPPKTPGGDGYYYYSGNGIPDRLQLNAAALIFHELVPGHHVHITRQIENEQLPEVRRNLFIFTAFNEGWAEYASGLAEEEGLLDDPYDYYGFLSHQRFVAQRLVVDTGLNALGWTFERAHAFMSAHTLEKPEQITSELLRYGSDLPAQALCYRWGFLKFRELRSRAQALLGARFSLADFHEAILEQGCVPIPLLEKNLEAWAQERAGDL